MHEIIAIENRIAARIARAAAGKNAPVRPFSIERIRSERFVAICKHPDKSRELRPTRPVARREAARLRPVAERTGSLVEKLAHRVRRAGKLRLFRAWKLVGKHRGPVEEGADEISPTGEISAAAAAERAAHAAGPTRPLAERLAWLRRTRRL